MLCCCYCSYLPFVYLHSCTLFFHIACFVSCKKRNFVIVVFASCRSRLKTTKAVKIQQIGAVTQRVTQTVAMMKLSMPVSENVS
jgi:hypothetical protein